MAKDFVRKPADRSKWPHNPTSNIVEPWPHWREVDLAKLTVSKLRQCLPAALQELRDMDIFRLVDPHVQKAVEAFSENRPFEQESCDLILTPERLVSLTEQSNKAELARAGINVGALFQLATNAIATGDLTGSPLGSREKIDLIKFLANKVLPDMKPYEAENTRTKIDRGRKRASEFSPLELKQLSHQELLDLLEE